MTAIYEARSQAASFTNNNTDSAYSAHTMLSAYIKACLTIILGFLPRAWQACAHCENILAEAGSKMDHTNNEKNADQRNPSRGVASCHR